MKCYNNKLLLLLLLHMSKGTTLTLALVSGWLLTTANTGDSNAVLDDGVKVVEVTNSHRIQVGEGLGEAGLWSRTSSGPHDLFLYPAWPLVNGALHRRPLLFILSHNRSAICRIPEAVFLANGDASPWIDATQTNA